MKLFKGALFLISMCFIGISYAWKLQVHSVGSGEPLITAFEVEDTTTILAVKNMLKNYESEKQKTEYPIGALTLYRKDGNALTPLRDDVKVSSMKTGETAKIYSLIDDNKSTKKLKVCK